MSYCILANTFWRSVDFFYKTFISLKNGVEPNGGSMEKLRTMEDVTDRTKPRQLSEILDAVQCQLVTMPEGSDSSSKVYEVSCI